MGSLCNMVNIFKSYIVKHNLHTLQRVRLTNALLDLVSHDTGFFKSKYSIALALTWGKCLNTTVAARAQHTAT